MCEKETPFSSCIIMNDEGTASEVSQEVSTEETRLMIPKIVCENFKSYAGIRELGPFHKVCVCTCAYASFE